MHSAGRRTRTTPALLPALALLAALAAPTPATGDDPSRQPAAPNVDFVRDVQPLLAGRCYNCHGPDEQNGGLRLDLKAHALRGGDSGVAIVPRRAADSRLIRLVSGRDPDRVMPPEGQRLTKAQVAVLRAWIDQGAVWPDEADGAWAAARNHWAFRPIADPPLPPVRNAAWPRNEIDAFVLSRLEATGVAPALRADRVTLIRRLSLDLTGLPPSPAEIDAFVAETRAGAYGRLVERLLASPHFGERWGRYWLDLARYADSDGYEDDRFRPDAWRFRDWVVAAVNDDMPFDRFTIEQLAGDLLPGAGYVQRVAAGFHRMALFNNAGAGKNDEEFRVKTAKDRAATTATVWLGLTLRCAECHSHKYDPLPQHDYYRLYAFFNNLEDTKLAAPRLPVRYYLRHQQAVREFRASQSRARAALRDYEQDVLPGKFAAWLQSVDRDTLPDALAEAAALTPEQRSEVQTARLEEYFRSIDATYVRLEGAMLKGGEISNNVPAAPSDKALSLKEKNPPRKTFVQVRGDFLNPGAEVQPGTPGFLPPLEATSAGMPSRLDLARWIVDENNPLTARVAANRVWQHLFGRGLVATAEDFGTQGARPTHPQLLDHLATQLVRSGWSRKHLIRLIVHSAAYQQSSRPRSELARRDPDNALLARQNRYRVEAEVVRDLALAASGLLNRAVGGPSVQPPLPSSLLEGLELKSERFMRPSGGAEQFRRGIYVNVQRTFLYPMFKDFDAADPNRPCTRRDRSVTPLQALTLLNDPAYLQCARALGRRMAVECDGPPRERIAHGFRLCLARLPEERETEILQDVYEAHRALYTEDPSAARDVLAGEAPETTDAADAAAWVAVARTLLNLDEFITRE